MVTKLSWLQNPKGLYAWLLSTGAGWLRTSYSLKRKSSDIAIYSRVRLRFEAQAQSECWLEWSFQLRYVPASLLIIRLIRWCIAYHMISPSQMEKLTLSRAVKSPNIFLSPIAWTVSYMKMLRYRA